MPADSIHPLGHHPWLLVETEPSVRLAALHETLLTLGNGRIGVRGAHEEGSAWPGTSQDAIYVNGFYETEDIHYPENSFGLARHNQFIVNVPNGKAMRWHVDGEAFDPAVGHIGDYRREFDMRSGRLSRRFTWTSPLGRRVAVRSERVVCLARPQLYALRYEWCALDGPATFTIESSLDARRHDLVASEDPRAGSPHAARALERVAVDRDGDRVSLLHRTRRSGLLMASGIEQILRVGDAAIEAHQACGSDDCPGLHFHVQAEAGVWVRLDKFCALVSSRDVAVDALAGRLAAELSDARACGFEALCDEQAAALADWWRDADVEIDGDDSVQQALRFNLLHLLQSAGSDGRTNIAAKGVTGSGYDGHYFWDTEIYIFPVLLHTRPSAARQLLEFRFNTLPAARARARELDHPAGALFPWRTIAGEECSSYFPAGTAQFHINADIAFAVKRYWEATGDDDFMLTRGAELVMETARIWLDLGHFVGERFCIHTVTGPDEYTALVDNNFYTNTMARMHLRFAVEVADWIEAEHPSLFADLATVISLGSDEVMRWRHAAECMVIPYEPALGIHPQDDSFLSKPRWEVADMDPAKRPLLLHYHSLVIYRHQVCKQADVLLALLLLDREFERADKRRDFDYYEPITTHDSSLSRCIFGMVASEIGYDDKAYSYFVDGVRTDLDDHHHNTHGGVHTAAMAGAWLGVVMGFGGLRMRDGVAHFTPRLPPAWTRCAFKLSIGNARLRVQFDRDGYRYQLVSGDTMALYHFEHPVHLDHANPSVCFSDKLEINQIQP